MGPVPTHALGMAFGLAMFLAGQRGFGHQRPEPGIIGHISELCKLLVSDRQLLTKVAQAGGDLLQSSLH